ncbi:MAG: hypothetical protein AVDCRST_MAG29-1943 [uncultured Nocardioidaceae bacterium]|uniref:Transmembrane protein n=1 Tax=uncultured Nocardioidaceae bacterium TaxID=253824 RepID=A0A6J4M044_9ACTN|nr:MAG: hypothetical protein AVDCRST_MAG29-1943 [uncultured Nocardioidaceae bacterium]
MTLLALWLFTVAGADLMRWEPARAGRRWPALGVGAGVLAVVAGAIGLPASTYALLLVAGIALLAVWVLTSERAFAGRGSDRVALLAVGAPVPLALATSGWSVPAGGALAAWMAQSDLPALAGVRPEELLLGAGVAAFLLNTSNLIVRLVLALAGTLAITEQSSLRGGRMLGPLERTFIFGLGLAGELTAASIVIAAKGLLRYPEISEGARWRRRDRAAAMLPAQSLTEYFLIGTLTSWLLSLGFLPLL